MRTLDAAYSIRAHVCGLYALVFLCVLKAAGGLPFSFRGLAWGAGVYLTLQLAYLLNRLEDISEDEFNGDAFRLGRGSRRAALVSLSFCLALLAAAALLSDRASWPVLAYGLVVVPLYSWPGFPLKRFMFFKPLSVAAGFFLISFFLPLSLAAHGCAAGWRSIPGLAYSNWRLFAVFFLNSVFLDLRDEPGDARAGVSTFPAAFGVRRTAIAISVSSAALGASFFALGASGPAIFCFLFSAVSAGATLATGRAYYNHVILLEDAVCLAALFL